VLLIGALKDPRFINESRDLVTNLVSHIVLQEQSQAVLKELVVETLSEDEFKAESIEVLKWLTKQKESDEIMAVFLKKVILRKDVLDNVSIMMTNSVINALEKEEVAKVFQEFLGKVVYSNKI
jgi:hypothetical protein